MTNRNETVKEKLQALEILARDLSLRLEKLSLDLSKTHSADWEEQAIERENDEVLERLRDETALELSQVQQAIQRLEKGAYTRCTRCGREISAARLQALPYTTVCISCATALSDNQGTVPP